MIEQQVLSQYLLALLNVSLFKDYCPNGLQIEGKQRITRIMTGVTASQKLIDEAIIWGADALIVHHGYFWQGEPPALTGIKYQRIAKLIKQDINLYAFHLPLDCHQRLGNNVQLGECLGLENLQGYPIDGTENLVWSGELNEGLSIADLSKLLYLKLGQKPLLLYGQIKGSIKKLAWCTGAAHRYASFAKDLGADAFITGEVSEQTFHIANEENIHIFAAGHHATERFGVRALGEHLKTKFGLVHQFIDIPNPV